MTTVYFITHPDVNIDHTIPIEQWHLSEEGIRKAGAMLKQPWIPTIKHIFCSDEVKAKSTAIILDDYIHVEYNIAPKLGEINRSSTGYLPSEKFEELVEQFFTTPTESVCGWEKAVDAQKRICDAVDQCANQSNDESLAIISHGAVGALLIANVTNQPISKSHLPPGMGYFTTIDWYNKQCISPWQPIELTP